MKSTEQIPGPASVKQETHHMLHAGSNSHLISFTPPTWLGQEEIWIFYNITPKIKIRIKPPYFSPRKELD